MAPGSQHSGKRLQFLKVVHMISYRIFDSIRPGRDQWLRNIVPEKWISLIRNGTARHRHDAELQGTCRGITTSSIMLRTAAVLDICSKYNFLAAANWLLKLALLP